MSVSPLTGPDQSASPLARGHVMATGQSITYRLIPSAPGYRVGDNGTVWSAWDRVGLQTGGTRMFIGKRWRRLKTVCRRDGYVKVVLCSPIRRTHLVHRLVLESFVGPCPPGMECCHGDRNRSNNIPSNLRWDTRMANTQDRVRHGTDNRGSRHGRSKLTETTVAELRADRAAGMDYPALMRKYGVSKPTVSHVISRRTWTHI
jgi:hypothetical protein